MGIIHKLMVVVALFLTSNGTAFFVESEQSAKGETSQTDIDQVIHKSETIKTAKEKELLSESASTTEQIAQEDRLTSSSLENNELTSQTEQVAPKVEIEAKEVTEPTQTESFNEKASVSTTTQAENESSTATQTVSQQAMQLKINGQLIPYTNAGQENGQAIIDSNPNKVATWGGEPTQSRTDNANTHFIGHNPGIFNILFSLQPGAVISVTDATGTTSDYHITQIITVDDSGYAADGTDYWDQITGTGGGERITLQTCINDDDNLIVFANA